MEEFEFIGKEKPYSLGRHAFHHDLQKLSRGNCFVRGKRVLENSANDISTQWDIDRDILSEQAFLLNVCHMLCPIYVDTQL